MIISNFMKLVSFFRFCFWRVNLALKLDLLFYLVFWNKFIGRLLIYKGVSAELSRKSIISIKKGVLSLGVKWVQKGASRGILRILEGGKIICDSDFIIYDNFKIIINKDAVFQIGSGYINNGLNIEAHCSIRIGKNFAGGDNLTLKDWDSKNVNGGNNKPSPVVIGDDVWIGVNVTILKGVTIGDGAIVAAGSLVTKSVLPRSMVAGVPAREIRSEVVWS